MWTLYDFCYEESGINQIKSENRQDNKILNDFEDIFLEGLKLFLEYLKTCCFDCGTFVWKMFLVTVDQKKIFFQLFVSRLLVNLQAILTKGQKSKSHFKKILLFKKKKICKTRGFTYSPG